MEHEEVLETFTFCDVQENREVAYRVTGHEDHYAVERDGKFYAEIKCIDGHWQQAAGLPLSEEEVGKIADRIEAHFA